jgi:PPOX class probable FMN-dependent enzyme
VTGIPVTTRDQLAESYPPPTQGVLDKDLDRLDRHCQEFIARSPMVLLATSAADGTCDVSPRGGAPGFVSILDERHLSIPDARGNRRLDSFHNVLENAHAGLLFLIPGMGETLRVNGGCCIVRDGDAVSLVVEADQVFLHCAKALIRSRLWEPATWPAPDERPSAAEIFGDHMQGLGSDGAAEMLQESYTHRL